MRINSRDLPLPLKRDVLAKLFTEEVRKGPRLDSRQRESSINQLLTAKSKRLRCPLRSKKMRQHAQYFRFLRGERENRGRGWRSLIRTALHVKFP
jgi:hypothetical protein